MSRVGKALIQLPKGVNLSVDGTAVDVKGPLGQLRSPLPSGISLEEKDGQVSLKRQDDSREQKMVHGMARALLANNVAGVSEGWKRNLELVGVGYRARLQGKEVVFSLGYSHEVNFPVPDDVKIQVTDQVRIEVTGIDKQRVGQVSAEIRSLRPPEPYKGKGVKYTDEQIRRKAGKAGKAGKK